MIVIFAHETDPHARVVAREVNSRGADAAVIDPRSLAKDSTLSTCISGARASSVLVLPNSTIEFDCVQSFWCRRMWGIQSPRSVVSPVDREFVQVEHAIAIEGALGLYSDRCISPPERQRRANNKLVQLAAARTCGLAIPATCVTNCKQQTTEFLTQLPGDAVHKTLHSPAHRLLETKLLDAEDILGLDSLWMSPAIFQERIHFRTEFRVTIVGEQVFTAERNLPAQSTQVDSRLIAGVRWEPSKLPPDIEFALLKLQTRLGLSFATVDLVEDSSGRIEYLETNPQGQFLYVEIDTGLPISAAVADLLLSPRGG